MAPTRARGNHRRRGPAPSGFRAQAVSWTVWKNRPRRVPSSLVSFARAADRRTLNSITRYRGTRRPSPRQPPRKNRLSTSYRRVSSVSPSLFPLVFFSFNCGDEMRRDESATNQRLNQRRVNDKSATGDVDDGKNDVTSSREIREIAAAATAAATSPPRVGLVTHEYGCVWQINQGNHFPTVVDRHAGGGVSLRPRPREVDTKMSRI